MKILIGIGIFGSISVIIAQVDNYTQWTAMAVLGICVIYAFTKFLPNLMKDHREDRKADAEANRKAYDKMETAHRVEGEKRDAMQRETAAELSRNLGKMVEMQHEDSRRLDTTLLGITKHCLERNPVSVKEEE